MSNMRRRRQRREWILSVAGGRRLRGVTAQITRERSTICVPNNAEAFMWVGGGLFVIGAIWAATR